MDENIKDAIDFASSDNITDMQSSIISALQAKISDALDAKRIEVAQSFMQTSNESEEPVDDFEEEDLNEYEIVKIYNPKTGKHEYVDDEGNVMHGSGGASWQKSWYSRKRPSDYSSSTPSSTSQKIYHNVPFKQKDQAKAEGMRFDGEKKKWYHTNDEKSKKSAFPKLQESYLEEKLSVSDGISTWIKDFVHSDDSRFEGKSKEERRQMAMAAFYSAKKQQNEEVQQILEAKRLISTHGDGVHTAKVYRDPEFNEYQVHFFKNGKHMGEGPVSYHDNKDDAVSTAKHETNRMNSNVSESAPSSGLSASEKSSIVKKAKAGKDIGKKGKGFEKVVAKAKKYGAEDPKAVAAAAMWKNIKR